MKIKFPLITFVLILLAFTIQAQEKKDDSQSNSELARKLANPNATIGFLAFPIDFISYTGDLPNASSQSAYKLNFQPSLPYKISEGTNFFLRPLVPVIIQQPVFTAEGFEDRGVDLGDIAFDAAIGKTWESKWVTIGGVFGSAPTATDDAFGAQQWVLGPNAFIGKATKWGFAGVLVNQSIGLGSDEDPTINITGGQYFYTINLKDAWQIQAQPVWSYNHEAPSGSEWTLPIGTGISNIYSIGNLPLRLNLQYWYFAAQAEAFGPLHQIRIQIIPIVPLPW